MSADRRALATSIEGIAAYLEHHEDDAADLRAAAAALREDADLRLSLDCQTELLEQARDALHAVRDRMDDFAYDELACPLDDGVTDEHGELYRSENTRLRVEVDRLRAGIEAHGRTALRDGPSFVSERELDLWALLDAAPGENGRTE